MKVKNTIKANYFARFGIFLFVLLLISSCGPSGSSVDIASDVEKDEIIDTIETVELKDEKSDKSSHKKEKETNENEDDFSDFKKEIEKKISSNESKLKSMMKKSKKESSSFIEKLNLLEKENENLKTEIEEFELTSASKLEKFKIKMFNKVDRISLDLDQMNFQEKAATENTKVIPMPIDTSKFK